MKDRIKQLMDDQHLTQQSFAQLIGSTPATLSNISMERPIRHSVLWMGFIRVFLR